MNATTAARQLGMSQHDFSQRLLDWLQELGIKPARVVVLEEHLSAEAFAERAHLDKSTAYRVFETLRPRRELSRKCVRVPASACAAFLANKTLPKRKAKG